MTALIDELEELIDDKRERVADLLRRIREEWPKPMTLVFVNGERRGGWMKCATILGNYEYFLAEDGLWRGDWSDFHDFKSATEPEIIAAMQSHFNAAWQAMTEGGK